MGLAASQCRLLALTARLSDLELKAQQISAIKIRLATQSADNAVEYTSKLQAAADNHSVLSPEQENEMNAAEAAFNAHAAQLEAQDKMYDLELKNIDTEHNACQTEIESVKKVIDKNIERSFKIFDA